MKDMLFLRRFVSHLRCLFALGLGMLLTASAAAQDAQTRQRLKAAFIRPLRTPFNRNATMQKTALLILILGAILFLAYPTHAQSIGDRMRITSQHGEEIIGQIKSLDNASLTILTDYSRELSIAYADMVQLERSLGRRSHYKKGAAIGSGIGASVGLLGVITSECHGVGLYGHDDGLYDCEILAAAGIVILSGVGALLGLIAGAAIRTERWGSLDIPGQSTASVMPFIGIHPSGSLALGARISF